VFLRRIQAGASDRSYGIHVAQLAGVSEAVVERARAILHNLEKKEEGAAERIVFGDARPRPPRDVQLGLFSPLPPSAVLEGLKTLDLERLTPFEALAKLVELQRSARAEP